ncbi:hypothetical protein ACFPN7_33600 [Amycolatopsis halotolerans]
MTTNEETRIGFMSDAVLTGKIASMQAELDNAKLKGEVRRITAEAIDAMQAELDRRHPAAQQHGEAGECDRVDQKPVRDAALDRLALGSRCHRCGAGTDEPCRTPKGNPTVPHQRRIDRAVRQYQSPVTKGPTEDDWKQGDVVFWLTGQNPVPVVVVSRNGAYPETLVKPTNGKRTIWVADRYLTGKHASG